MRLLKLLGGTEPLRFSVHGPVPCTFLLSGAYIMPDFEKLYHKMVHAAEVAISVLEQGNVWEARRILIDAEQYAEAQYIGESEPADGYNCLDSFILARLLHLMATAVPYSLRRERLT